MKTLLIRSKYYLIYVGLILLLWIIQTTVWSFISDAKGPLLALPVLVYWFLHRLTKEALIMIYISTALAVSFEGVPIGITLVTFCSLYIFHNSLWSRFYKEDIFSFMFANTVSLIFFAISNSLFSFIFDSRALHSFQWQYWLYNLFILSFLSLPIWLICSYIDEHMTTPDGGII